MYQRLPSPSVIMCCRPIREAVRAATHYYTRALQTLIHGKECYIVIVIYLPNQHMCLRYNNRTTFRNNWPRASIPLIHGSGGLHSYLYIVTEGFIPIEARVCFSYVFFFKQTSSRLSLAGFNENEARRYRVLMGLKPAAAVYKWY